MTGQRLEWQEVPAHIREQVARRLGRPVLRAENQSGGFSPGVAARCELADGRRCFIKAVSAAQNPESPDMYRREGQIAGLIPPHLPAPRLLDVIDEEGWVVLIFEEVDGRLLSLPWTLEELGSTLTALSAFVMAATPCPIPGLPTFFERHVEMFGCYRRLAAGHPTLSDLDPWSRRHLDRLAKLEAEWPDASEGNSLLHSDLRADNLLVVDDEDRPIVIVDWPHACVGAGWIDVACMLPSVGLDGGPQPLEVEQALNPFDGIDAQLIDRVLVGLAGYFTFHGLQPDPPGLPTLRHFQRAQGVVTRDWLAARLHLE
jgi:hypothetical protein